MQSVRSLFSKEMVAIRNLRHLQSFTEGAVIVPIPKDVALADAENPQNICCEHFFCVTAECIAADAFKHAGENIVFGSGNPFENVQLENGKVGYVTQANNMYLFPGLETLQIQGNVPDNVVVLVYGNQHEVPGAMSASEISNKLDLVSLRQINWKTSRTRPFALYVYVVVSTS